MIKMSKMHKRVIAAHGAVLAFAAVPGGVALAQTAQATELQTVTVTAQRRTENIKEVPVSVTAIKGEKLDVLVSGGQDIRLLAGMKQIEEPFEAEQVGSSAMAYKRNPMRCERATGLARFVISLSTSPLQTAAEQWFERTLDDSANKRLSVPEPFLAIDGCLQIVVNVARGLVVYPKVIESFVLAELPFMATEEILMAGVRAGGDRRELHEVIRKHSQDAAREVKMEGKPNDLLDRLKSESAFKSVNLSQVMDPRQYVGRAPEQTTAFIEKVVEPIRVRYAQTLNQRVELKV